MGNIWTESHENGNFMGYDLENLKMDQCYLTIENKDYNELYLYQKYQDCFQCPYIYKNTLLKNQALTFVLETKFPITYRLLSEDIGISLQNNYTRVVDSISFGKDYAEFGVYKVIYANNAYDFQIVKEPANIYFPILTVFLIYALLFLLIPIGRYLWKYVKFERLDLPFVDEDKNERKASKRVQSLDTFRGISIVLMIFVNYGHGGYAFLEHAIWNGLYVGDLVFPWFLWIMGVCIPISVQSHFRKDNAKASHAIKNILKRSIKLFAIGIFLGSSPFLDKLRIFGVLQRFAICYLVVGTLSIVTYPKRNSENEVKPDSNSLKSGNKKDKLLKYVQDLIQLKFQWVFMMFVVLLHCLLTFCLQVPNCPTGYLGPGGLHDDKKYENCTGGAAGYIDNVILGEHIYHHPYIVEIYKAKPFDPEGILGCLTSIFQVFLGVQAGTILLTYKDHKDRLIRWSIWSVLLGLLGGLLCGFSAEDGVIPLNKHLWSLSFVLVTSCFAYFLLSFCYVIIDVFNFWTGKPFLFAGMNAILMYVGHNMTYGNYFPIHWYLSAEEINSTHFITLLENVWATSFWVLVSYYLYKIKFFWTI